MTTLPFQTPVSKTKKIWNIKQADLYFRTGETSAAASGSITAEAALALPIFLFFAGWLLSLFISLKTGTVLLFEADREAASAAESVRALAAENDNAVAVKSWQDGFFSGSELSVIRRTWTGRFLSDDNTEHRYVIVTDSGSVYHLTEGCTYLSLSVREVPAADVPMLRTVDGAKYHPCERCAGGDVPGSLFITSSGRRFHADRGCSGLKRSWRWVLLEECGLPPCGRCAQ